LNQDRDLLFASKGTAKDTAKQPENQNFEVMSKEFKARSRELAEEGRKIVEELKYADDVQSLMDKADLLIENIKNDDFVSALREKAGILAQDLFWEDKDGHPHLNTDALTNMRKSLVPVLADALKYIPIPRIEDKNAEREYTFDNIVLCGYDIIPENIQLRLESNTQVNVRELETDFSSTRLVVSIKRIRTEVKDVFFHYKRNVFPQMEDFGKVTVRLSGQGAELNITFNIRQEQNEKAPKFVNGKVNFAIHNMDIEFDKATLTHDVLVPMFTGLFKAQIVHGIERAVEKNLGKLVNDLGAKVHEGLNQPRFNAQIQTMKDQVKLGEFATTYRRRQEKLE